MAALCSHGKAIAEKLSARQSALYLNCCFDYAICATVVLAVGGGVGGLKGREPK